MSIYIAFCGCYTTNVLRLFFGIQFLLASVGDLYSFWSLYRIFGGEGWFKEHSSSILNYWWSTSSLRIESMYSSILWHKSFFLFGWCFSSLLWEFWVKFLRFLLRLLQNVGCYWFFKNIISVLFLITSRSNYLSLCSKNQFLISDISLRVSLLSCCSCLYWRFFSLSLCSRCSTLSFEIRRKAWDSFILSWYKILCSLHGTTLSLNIQIFSLFEYFLCHW